jgi:putative protease
LAEVDVKNRFQVGDQLELIMPGGNHSFRLDLMQDMTGKSTDVAPGSGHHVRIPLPTEECTMGLLAVNLSA